MRPPNMAASRRAGRDQRAAPTRSAYFASRSRMAGMSSASNSARRIARILAARLSGLLTSAFTIFPTEAALLRCQLLFDVGVHSVGKNAMVSEHGLALVQNVLL